MNAIENRTGRPRGSGRKPKSYEKLVRDNQLRTSIDLFMQNNFEVDKVQKIYDELEPKDKLAFLKDMLAYSLPKYATIEYTTDKKDEKSSFWGDQFKGLKEGLVKVS